MFNPSDLFSHLVINSSMTLHHKYTLSDLENMLPWERDFYVSQVQKYVEKKNDKTKK